jgi:CheY-like chemotaxis protein
MARVLIFEPDLHVRQLLELQVEHLGHETVRGDSLFDIALIEPAVPDGFAFARALRDRFPDLPLVFVSVRFPTGDTAALRPHAHLVKPFGLRVLGSALAGAEEMLASSRS